MPRQKHPGAPEPKRRSRKGCWPCKARKVKCGEEHPTCKNCRKTGDICDYSVRLNWEGRRTKRSVPDDMTFGSPTLTSNQIQWQHHDFDVKNDQVLEPDNEYSQKSNILDKKPDDLGFAETISLTTPIGVAATAYLSHQTGYEGKALIFIDESRQLLSTTTGAEGCVAKRRLAKSNGTRSSKSSQKGSQLHSLALSARRKRNMPTMKLTVSKIEVSRSLGRSTDRREPRLSIDRLSCSSTADGPPTPAASLHSDDATQQSNWMELQSWGSLETRLSGNGASKEPSMRSGNRLSEEAGLCGFHDLSNSNFYPSGAGTFYGYDVGIADRDLLQSDVDNANLLLPAVYTSQGNVGFGEETMSRHKHNIATAVNSRYYDNVVPIIMPWAFEPLPDM